jgi:chromosome segregation ATPase
LQERDEERARADQAVADKDAAAEELARVRQSLGQELKQAQDALKETKSEIEKSHVQVDTFKCVFPSICSDVHKS